MSLQRVSWRRGSNKAPQSRCDRPHRLQVTAESDRRTVSERKGSCGSALVNRMRPRALTGEDAMPKRILRTCAVAVATTIASTACTSLRVSSDVNPGVNASQCHSYAWAGAFHANPGVAQNVANPLNETRLRNAIAANLQSKGVAPASANADCLVGYGIGVQSVIEGGYPYGPYGWGWAGRRGFYGGWGGYDYPYAY